MLLERIVGSPLADSLGGGSQLARQFVLHRLLQVAEPGESQLGGEADHRCRARACGGSEVGNGAEPDELRPGEQRLGDATLGAREGTT